MGTDTKDELYTLILDLDSLIYNYKELSSEYEKKQILIGIKDARDKLKKIGNFK